MTIYDLRIGGARFVDVVMVYGGLLALLWLIKGFVYFQEKKRERENRREMMIINERDLDEDGGVILRRRYYGRVRREWPKRNKRHSWDKK